MSDLKKQKVNNVDEELVSEIKKKIERARDLKKLDKIGNIITTKFKPFTEAYSDLARAYEIRELQIKLISLLRDIGRSGSRFDVSMFDFFKLNKKNNRLNRLFNLLKYYHFTFDMFLKEVYGREITAEFKKEMMDKYCISEEEIFRLGEKMPFSEILTDGGKFNALKGMVEGFLPFNKDQDLRITPSVGIILKTSPVYQWRDGDMNNYDEQGPQKVICKMTVRYNFKVITATTDAMDFLRRKQNSVVHANEVEKQRFDKHNNDSSTVKILAGWDTSGSESYDGYHYTLRHQMDYYLLQAGRSISVDSTFFTLDRLREFQKKMSVLIPEHFALLCELYFPDSKTTYPSNWSERPNPEDRYKAVNDKIFTPGWFSSDLLNDKKGFLKLLDSESEDLDNKYLLYNHLSHYPPLQWVRIKSIEKNGYRLKLDMKPTDFDFEGEEVEVAIDDLPEYMRVQQIWDVFNFSIRFTPDSSQEEELIFKNIMLKYNVPSGITKKTKMLKLMNLKF